MILGDPVRLTRQRQVVLDELRSVTSHPTAEEVHDLARRRLPRISLGTVYRNLDVLCSSGLVRRLDLAGRQMRFDGDTTRHYHIRCVACDRVDDVPVETSDELEAAARMATRYDVLGHSVEFVGLCPSCRNEKERGTAGGGRR